MNNFNTSKPTRLSKVYFTWVIRDFGTAEWFHSLLHAIEEQDTQNRIEINIYLTQKLKEDEMNNIIVQDVGAEKDAITSLRAPTHFGRPNWDRVFSSIAEKHPETDVGVVCARPLRPLMSCADLLFQFFCGPAVLSRQLHTMSNKYSTPRGTRFFFGKGALPSVSPCSRRMLMPVSSVRKLLIALFARRVQCYVRACGLECTISYLPADTAEWRTGRSAVIYVTATARRHIVMDGSGISSGRWRLTLNDMRDNTSDRILVIIQMFATLAGLVLLICQVRFKLCAILEGG
jgi:hypothetical protein